MKEDNDNIVITWNGETGEMNPHNVRPAPRPKYKCNKCGYIEEVWGTHEFGCEKCYEAFAFKHFGTMERVEQ